MDKKQTYYELLSISRDASTQEVTAAYRAAVREYQPLLLSGNRKINAKIKLLNAALETLANSEMRADYDRGLDDPTYRKSHEEEKRSRGKTQNISKSAESAPKVSKVFFIIFMIGIFAAILFGIIAVIAAIVSIGSEIGFWGEFKNGLLWVSVVFGAVFIILRLRSYFPSFGAHYPSC